MQLEDQTKTLFFLKDVFPHHFESKEYRNNSIYTVTIEQENCSANI